MLDGLFYEAPKKDADGGKEEFLAKDHPFQYEITNSGTGEKQWVDFTQSMTEKSTDDYVRWGISGIKGRLPGNATGRVRVNLKEKVNAETALPGKIVVSGYPRNNVTIQNKAELQFDYKYYKVGDGDTEGEWMVKEQEPYKIQEDMVLTPPEIDSLVTAVHTEKKEGESQMAVTEGGSSRAPYHQTVYGKYNRQGMDGYILRAGTQSKGPPDFVLPADQIPAEKDGLITIPESLWKSSMANGLKYVRIIFEPFNGMETAEKLDITVGGTADFYGAASFRGEWACKDALNMNNPAQTAGMTMNVNNPKPEVNAHLNPYYDKTEINTENNGNMVDGNVMGLEVPYEKEASFSFWFGNSAANDAHDFHTKIDFTELNSANQLSAETGKGFYAKSVLIRKEVLEIAD